MKAGLATVLTLPLAASLFLATPADAASGALATVADVRAALEALKPEDTAASAPELDALMSRLFPVAPEGLPCGAPGSLLSSLALCEWHARAAQEEALPDLFVSVSAETLDSVVFWGREPLRSSTWACTQVTGRKAAVVCLPRTLPAARRETLVREWTQTLERFTRPADGPAQTQP
ncbi:hypothetical protein HT136_13115 [Novosphingobium profundi]|uniref:hypothetical protein n=1 Tax=Novosphingobium profundi TaxID=1774954 RepID=UPI001BDB1B1E|nr:hypothetical protein [Novosphingobium profundi]MBT0669305.1 hypothetical protein [Novosphingobium profundi]